MTSRITKLLTLTVLATLLLPACADRTGQTLAPSRLVHVAGRQFVDPSGHPILLHGINVCNKSKAEGYTGGLGPREFSTIRSWGMNCVRLGIFWDGLEPEPGKFDAAYLDRVAQLVQWAKKAGLWVMLDMHQDLYSVKFSDGAPPWATLDNGNPHTPTPVWSDAYYASTAVQSALDHFWSNSPASDGVGLQDHYAKAWKRVAARFANEPAVLGYDLMNEPFPGEDALHARDAIIGRMAELASATGGASNSPSETPKPGTPEAKKLMIQRLADMRVFEGMLEAGAPIFQEFERGRLMPMYQRVANAIRTVDQHHILFIEPAMSSNIGIPSALGPVTDAHGARDPHQAYAPHGYDLVTDTDNIELTSNKRVELIFRRHGEKSRSLNMPMLVGEWGAFYEDSRAVGPAKFAVSQFDQLGCGDTYWSYGTGLEKSPLLPALQRNIRLPESR